MCDQKDKKEVTKNIIEMSSVKKGKNMAIREDDLDIYDDSRNNQWLVNDYNFF